MAYLQIIANTVVIAGVGVLITWVTRTQMGDLRTELRDARTESKSDLRELRSEIRTEIGDLRSEMRAEIASLRSDLTQIALAVGAQARPQAG